MHPLFIKRLTNTTMKFNGNYKKEALTKTVIESPVQLEDVKRNLRFDDPTAAHADDDSITQLIEAAREAAENYTGRIIAKSEVKFYAYNFSDDYLEIEATPILGIKSIRKSIDNGATFTALTEDTDFDILKAPTKIEIQFKTNISADEIEIIFYAGYETADMPPSIKKWIIVEASDGYDTERSQYLYQVNRGDLKQRSLSAFIINKW